MGLGLGARVWQGSGKATRLPVALLVHVIRIIHNKKTWIQFSITTSIFLKSHILYRVKALYTSSLKNLGIISQYLRNKKKMFLNKTLIFKMSL